MTLAIPNLPRMNLKTTLILHLCLITPNNIHVWLQPNERPPPEQAGLLDLPLAQEEM